MNVKSVGKAVAAVCIALSYPALSLAEEPEAVSVEASGFGETVELAKKAAGRAAIEQVVGQMVDAESLVENDELIKDKILQYSGGTQTFGTGLNKLT